MRRILKQEHACVFVLFTPKFYACSRANIGDICVDLADREIKTRQAQEIRDHESLARQRGREIKQGLMNVIREVSVKC